MTLPLTLPLLNRPKTTKDRVFIILSRDHPLSLIKIKNSIKSIFNDDVSFQSVRKAVLQLVDEGVLVKEGKEFYINKEWIFSLIKFGNLLQKNYFSIKKDNSKVDIGENVIEYHLNSLLDLDFVWNGIIRDALKKTKSNKVITFKAVHFWFLIATLAQETELMKEMIREGVKLYYVCYGNTPLDKWTVEIYNKIGVHAVLARRPKNFIPGLNIGTYGDVLVQSQHPPELTKKMDNFFAKCKAPEDASLADITNLVTEKHDIPLQVLHNSILTEAVRNEIKNEVLKKF